LTDTLQHLRRAAREIFDDALAEMDAGRAVRRAVRLDDARLTVVDTEFDLGAHAVPIYSIGVGKAAGAMARALDEALGERLSGGIISTNATELTLSERWRVFAGGHPVPNEASLAAARASFDLLRRADESAALVLFLISGGGSAMIEWPRERSVTLSDLRELNRVLVSCGASIEEINAVRRAVSAVKGGGLSACAPRARQITLIVSDTNTGDETNVASGPTLAPLLSGAHDAATIVSRYNLATRLPASVLRAIDRARGAEKEAQAGISAASATKDTSALRRHYVLLDNERALECAARAAREQGFVVEVARDLIEQPVAEGSAALVARLFELSRREAKEGRGVCLISGGEFACPVRGEGVGGRNAETALRCAFELATHAGGESIQAVALSAGTDGIDGNSPAAGALADHTTLARSRALNLDARQHLDRSDAYTFFRALGDSLNTGPTGTNVRDLRILLRMKAEG
jgi:glycerate 2-kinase